ncbi:MAG: hypothetical protein ACTH31_01760 [Pseudoclavibacter sp.]
MTRSTATASHTLRDPAQRLPGLAFSGRELSELGIGEFLNRKLIRVAPGHETPQHETEEGSP